MYGKLTSSQVQAMIEDATCALGLDIVYDDATFDLMELKSFSDVHWEENDKKLVSGVKLKQAIDATARLN